MHPKPASICEASSKAARQVTKILDIPELLRKGFAQTAPKRQSLATTSATKAVQNAAVEITRQRLVTFEVAGQDYALPLEVVREIVTAPENLTFVPGSDDAVRGVMPYRDGLLPLLSYATPSRTAVGGTVAREGAYRRNRRCRDRVRGGSYPGCAFGRS